MELPYSIDVYLALLDNHNQDNLFAVLFGLTICCVAVAGTFIPAFRQSTIAKRLILLGIAGCSAFVGVVHQYVMMADFNFMAPLYAGLWLVQSAVLFWFACSSQVIRLYEANPAQRLTGCLVGLYGVLLYPILVTTTLGSSGLGFPLAGSSPNPTILVMAGVILMVRNPPLIMLIVPFAWGVVSAMTAYLLQVPVDYGVICGVLILLAYTLRVLRKHKA